MEIISLNMKELTVNRGKKEGVRKRGEERLLKVIVYVCVNGYAVNKSQHASPESSLSKFDVIVSCHVSCLDRGGGLR